MSRVEWQIWHFELTNLKELATYSDIIDESILSFQVKWRGFFVLFKRNLKWEVAMNSNILYVCSYCVCIFFWKQFICLLIQSCCWQRDTYARQNENFKANKWFVVHSFNVHFYVWTAGYNFRREFDGLCIFNCIFGLLHSK